MGRPEKNHSPKKYDRFGYMYDGGIEVSLANINATREVLAAVLGRHFGEPWVPDVLKALAKRNPQLIIANRKAVKQHPAGPDALKTAWENFEIDEALTYA